MATTWLKTQIRTWPFCIRFYEGGQIDSVSPTGSTVSDVMSQQLQDLRAGAALRRQQQQEQTRAPLRSPEGSDFDVASIASLRSAASSRRSQMSRKYLLSQMASAKSDPTFDSVNSGIQEEEFENEDPNMYQEVKSVKSAVREEENMQHEEPRKEKSYSEKFKNIRCEI